MTAQQYRTERQKRGTRLHVAYHLKISVQTIYRRETGDPITKEAELALLALPVISTEQDD